MGYAAILRWDLLKCYEDVSLMKLEEEARYWNIPEGIIQFALFIYRSARIIMLDQAVSGKLFATRGIIAGCARALTLLQCLWRAGSGPGLPRTGKWD